MAIQDNCTLWNKLESANPASEPGYGPNGVDQGGPAYAAGKFGNGVVVDTNDGVRFLNAGNIFNKDVTIAERWLKPVGWSLTNAVPSDAGTHFLVNVWASGTHYYDVVFASGGFRWRIIRAGVPGGGMGAGSGFNIPEIDVADGEWFHLLFVWNKTGVLGGANTQRVYFNGALVATSNVAISLPTIPVGDHLDLGYRDIGAGPQQGWDGMIDNPKWYDSDVDLAAILANRNNEGWPVTGAKRMIDGGVRSNMIDGRLLVN